MQSARVLCGSIVAMRVSGHFKELNLMHPEQLEPHSKGLQLRLHSMVIPLLSEHIGIILRKAQVGYLLPK